MSPASILAILEGFFLGRDDLNPLRATIGKDDSTDGEGSLGFLQTLVDALEIEFLRIATETLAPHRLLKPDAMCRIDEITIRPQTPEAHHALSHVLTTLEKPDVVEFIKRIVLEENHQAAYFDFSKFKGIKQPTRVNKSQRVEQDAGERQALLDVMREIGLDDGSDQFLIRIACTFVQAPKPAVADNSKDAEWLIKDAGAARRLNLPAAPPSRPLKIGRNPTMEIPIKSTAKTLASAHHGNLWFDQGAWWYQDVGTTNGSRIVGDQLATLPASPTQSRAVKLTPGATIVFCAAEPKSNETSETHPSLQWEGNRAAVPKTPLAEVKVPGTPDTPVVAHKQKHSVQKTYVQLSGLTAQNYEVKALPATIGIDGKQNIRIPAAHISVSRHHLTVYSVDEDGADIGVFGRNGILRNGKVIRAGNRVRLLLGESIVLGHPKDDEPVCNLVILRR